MTAAKVRIRRAGRRDAADAAEVLLRSRRASAPAIPPMVHSAADCRSWLAGLIERSEEVWVAESSDDEERPDVVAVMVLTDGWLEQLYVAPGWTGRGVGSELLAQAKARYPDGLQLWTFQANSAAQRFYARHGFTCLERTDGVGNEERAPDVRMAWSPNPTR
jgi:GNAT superfamily N-acetyltransferase